MDLPGLFKVSKDDPELPKYIKKINKEYLEKPNTIPAVVVPANLDPANSQGLHLLNKLDLEEKSLGIIPKADIAGKSSHKMVEDLLNNKKYKLGYGYVALMLRNKKDIENGVTIKTKMKEEKEFFSCKTKIFSKWC